MYASQQRLDLACSLTDAFVLHRSCDFDTAEQQDAQMKVVLDLETQVQVCQLRLAKGSRGIPQWDVHDDLQQKFEG